MNSGNFAAIAITLYAAHHVGDYWVQRDVDARHKGDAGIIGQLHCLSHVLTYIATQTLFLIIALPVTHLRMFPTLAGFLVSGVTHYIADRKAPLRWLAERIGKGSLAKLGMPREHEAIVVKRFSKHEAIVVKRFGKVAGEFEATDNPQLATGLWALDQSWHIFWGVFVTALIMAVGS